MYNKLIEDKEALERKNRNKAYEVINQQKRNQKSDGIICGIRYNDIIKFEFMEVNYANWYDAIYQ